MCPLNIRPPESGLAPGWAGWGALPGWGKERKTLLLVLFPGSWGVWHGQSPGRCQEPPSTGAFCADRSHFFVNDVIIRERQRRSSHKPNPKSSVKSKGHFTRDQGVLLASSADSESPACGSECHFLKNAGPDAGQFCSQVPSNLTE